MEHINFLGVFIIYKITHSNKNIREKKNKNEVRKERNISEKNKSFRVEKYNRKKKNAVGNIIFKDFIYRVLIKKGNSHDTEVVE